MAIKGTYTWRGIDLEEAYVRVSNVSGNPRDGYAVEFSIFSSVAFAMDPENKYKGLQGSQIYIKPENSDEILSTAYQALKQLPELAHFIDC